MIKQSMDYHQFYDLESYLFDTVRSRFDQSGKLSAFDFFCIIIWKANRAKKAIAEQLLRKFPGDLQSATKELTRGLAAKTTPEERFQYLWGGWEIRGLAMVSAILTVLYPKDFTIYDQRVCQVLNDFYSIGNRTKVESVWAGYSDFIRTVREHMPQIRELREKDKSLWGKSFSEQLNQDINNAFGAHVPKGMHSIAQGKRAPQGRSAALGMSASSIEPCRGSIEM
jgi:hypothetical protein